MEHRVDADGPWGKRYRDIPFKISPHTLQEGDSGDKPNEYIENCICRKEPFPKVRKTNS